MNIVDLHVHSNKSDGSYSPAELVNYAIEKGLSAFALTDHDTTDGIEEAIKASENTSVELVPGIEFSTEYEGKDIHLIGLDIDYKLPSFQKQLKEFKHSRTVRNEKMCQKLREHGIEITWEALQAEYPGSVITRAHYAKFLLEHNAVKSMQEAFSRYIGDYAPCFIPREKVTPSQAIELILSANGIPILAHPTLYHLGKVQLDLLVAKLTASGLMGLEGVYSTYSASDERDMKALARKHGLCISGGSDFHGTAKPQIDLAVGYGRLFIPEELLLDLRKRKQYENSIH